MLILFFYPNLHMSTLIPNGIAILSAYLKKHGFDEGKILGKKLELLKQEWLNNNFFIDKKIIEKSLGKNYKN